MPVLDTSFLVALYNEDDARHQDALKETTRPGPFVVPGAILAEFLSVVTRRTRRTAGDAAAHQRARETLENLTAQPAFAVESDYDPKAASEIFHNHSDLSYHDAIAVSVSRRLGQELLTFDARQAKARGTKG